MENKDLHAAALDNALRYQAGTQTLAAGGALRLETCMIHGQAAIEADGDTGLRLAAGQYLIGFSADAAGGGSLGAVLALNGAPLRYTAAGLSAAGSRDARLTLQTILHLRAPGTVTVVNSADCALRYTDPVLTVVRLA